MQPEAAYRREAHAEEGLDPVHPGGAANHGVSIRLRLLSLIPGTITGLLMFWTSAVINEGRRFFTLFDDALISMAFARTLARTGELLWYPGADRVEGITNPGYTLIMAVPHLVGLDSSGAVAFISLLGLSFVLATAYLAGGLALRFHPSRLAAAATTVTVSLLFPLMFWSVFGLEVGLLALLATGLLTVVLRARDRGYPPSSTYWAAALSSAGIIVRPDFAVIAVTAGAWLVATSGLGSLPPRSSRKHCAAVMFAAVAATGALLTAARWVYYGALVPNTYTLKMGGSSLGDRMARVFEVHSLWTLIVGNAVLAVAAAFVLLKHNSTLRSPLILLALVAGGQTAYVVYVGGDIFEPDRFMVPASVCVAVLALSAAAATGSVFRRPLVITAVALGVLVAVPLLCFDGAGRLLALVPAGLLAMVLVGTTVRRRSPGVGPASAVAAVATGVVVVTLSAGNPIVGYQGWAADGEALTPLDRVGPLHARELVRIAAPGTGVAAYGVGALAYWGEGQLRVIDLLGKVDSVVAAEPRRGGFLPGHDKYDYMHSLVDLRPDLVEQDWAISADAPAGEPTSLFPPIPAEAAAVALLYDRLCTPAGLPMAGLPMLVLKDSTSVDRNYLTACP